MKMKNFINKIASVVVMAAISVSAFAVDGVRWAAESNSRIGRMLRTVQPVREFRGERPWSNPGTELSAKFAARSARKEAGVVNAPVPSVQFEKLNKFDFLEGPDGTTWFYTVDYEYETIDYGYGYSEDYITAYTFNIYNAAFEKVGEVSDVISLKEDETRAVSVVLDPVISDKFFNTDDLNEVIVYLAINTKYYVNRYYNKVYSIGGEKDEDGNDVSVGEFEGRIVDAVAVDNGAGDKEYYITFVTDFIPDSNDYDDFVDFVNAYAYHIETFRGATATEGPKIVLSTDVHLSNIPGDTTDGIYFISKVEGGVPYFIISYYEKPYFVDPTGFAQDESATPDNSLVIDVYNGESGAKMSTTSIPVVITEVDGKLTYAFYSIGSLAWHDDVIMSGPFGSPSSPAFIVARDFVLASNLEDVSASFDIYRNDGTNGAKIYENSDGLMKLSDIPGLEPQAMFVEAYGENNYRFHFIDLHSAKERAVIEQSNDGDPISAVCDRVASGDNDYKYAFEMTYYKTDDNGNENTRVAWFDSTGAPERIDLINVGKDVMACSVNLTQSVLNADLYDDTDEAMEYAVLVKRTFGNTTRNEFLVVDDNGDWLAHFTDDEGKGSPFIFTVVFGDEGNHLQMVYNDDSSYNVDIYDLPFLKKSGNDGIEDTVVAESLIGFDGTTITASGSEIEVFNATGLRVVSGRNAVSVVSLAKGVYVVVATDSNGNRSTRKITI